MYAVFARLRAPTVKGDDEDHGLPLAAQLPQLGSAHRRRQRLHRLRHHRGADRDRRDRRGHLGRRPPARTRASTGSSRRSRDKTLAPSRPCTTGCSRGSSRPATPGRPSAASALSTPPCGTSRRRSPGSRCGGSSARPTVSSPATHRGSTSPSTTSELAGFYRTMAQRGFSSGKLKGGRDVDGRHPPPRHHLRRALGQRRAPRPHARRERVVEPQAGRAVRLARRGGARPDLDRRAAAPMGCRRPGPAVGRGARRRRDRREPDRARAVPTAVRRRRRSTSCRPAPSGASPTSCASPSPPTPAIFR